VIRLYGFDNNNHLEEKHFDVLAILRVEKHWAEMKNSAKSYFQAFLHIFEHPTMHPIF